MSAHDTPEVGSGETACTCPDDDCRETCPVCIVLADDAPCAAQTARQPASPDPVQPADAGEGLSEAIAEVLAGHLDCSCPDLLDRYRVAHLSAVLHAEVERILAAREAAWAEKYAAVVGERDRAVRDVAALTENYVQPLATAEAALATALREKAEDRARVEARVRQIADEHEAVMDSIVPMPNRDERESGRKTVRDLRAALAIPTATGDE